MSHSPTGLSLFSLFDSQHQTTGPDAHPDLGADHKPGLIQPSASHLDPATPKKVTDLFFHRVIKETQQGETVYVNQYYVVRNRSIVSKHLYAGASRIVTHLVMGTAPGNNGQGAPGNGGGNGNANGSSKGNATTGHDNNGQHLGQDKDHSNNGLHLGQLKNGTLDKENPGQGRERRSDTADAHAQDINKNPTLTGNFPGQGLEHRSDQANNVAQSTSHNPNLIISEAGASVELGGDTSGGETSSGTTTAYTSSGGGQSDFLYFYHPDHLGSSGFVTDQNGELYEHMEYFPFGETWVQEHSNTLRTPYLYTGKELDQETQLYYYGARYYDPRTSVWQSADPIFGKYLPTGNKEKDANLPGMGGIFNTLNPNLYTYAHLNPVRYKDPDGNATASERANAIGVVNDYVDAEIKYEADNPGKNLYDYGSKGGPGQICDCSGLTIHAYPGLPAGTQAQVKATSKIDFEKAMVGDLVFFYGGASHTGVVTGVDRNSEGIVTKITFGHTSGSAGAHISTIEPPSKSYKNGNYGYRNLNSIRTFKPETDPARNGSNAAGGSGGSGGSGGVPILFPRLFSENGNMLI